MIDGYQFLREHAPKFPKTVLKREASACQDEAYKFALRSLSAAGASKKRLKERMKRKGFSQEAACKAIQTLEDAGFLNDENMAREIIEKSARNLEGESLVRFRLKKAGIEESEANLAIEEAKARLEEGREKFLIFLKEEAGSDLQKALKLCKKKGQPLRLAMKIGASYTPGSVAP